MNVNQIVSDPKLFFSLYLSLVHTFLVLTHGVHTKEEKYENSEAYCMILTVFLADILVKRDAEAFQNYYRYVQLHEQDILRQQQETQETTNNNNDNDDYL